MPKPTSSRISVSKVESKLNTLDTPFRRRGSAAVLAFTDDGGAWMHRLRHTNFAFIERFVSRVADAGSIDPAHWVAIDPVLLKEHGALVALDGTVYAAGRMPATEVHEDPMAPTGTPNELPKVQRVPSGMGYTL